MTGGWTRRAVLAAGLTMPAAGLQAAPAPRAAALDWGLAATLAALGAGPAAVAEQAGYAQWVRAPALPAGVAEIGLRTAPSFEALAALKPDLILTNALNAPLQARLERIAPVYASPIFAGRGAPVDGALLAVRELGDRLGRTAQAAALAGEAAARFAAARARLAGRVARPLVPLGFVDGRHARIYGTGSLFGDVMARLDLASGWTRPTNAWGFSVVPIEAIAACRGTDLLVIQPVPREARLSLEAPGLWSSLVAASDVRVLTLPPVWAFGDITAAMRCADCSPMPWRPRGATMVEAKARHATSLAIAVLGLAVILASMRMSGQLAPAGWLGAALHPDGGEAAQLVFHYATLPRLVVAALCGAGLAASGAIFQHVLGNPLASPVTLGVSSGAELALVSATLFAPATLGAVPDLVALAGGLASMALVFVVAARQRFSTLGLILSGLCVGLFCGALGGLLKLFNQDYLDAVFLWGAGSLAQQDWTVVQRLLPRLAILAVAAALLLRPLRVLGLSQDGARGLGVSLALDRTLTLGVAVALAASVTAAVGMIGFIEIAAPLIARLAGARTLGHRLVVAVAIGAGLLVIVDTAVQVVDERTGGFLPTGAATALLGAPLLLWLLPRLRGDASMPVGGFDGGGRGRARPGVLLPGLAALACAGLLAGLAIGRDGTGWSVLGPADVAAILPWRVWRVAEAFAGGAMAAAAGTLLQRLTGNPMASPEILGLGAAVMAGITLALVVDPAPSLGLLLAAGSTAALALTAFVLWRGSRSRFAPDHLLLTGVALSAALDAVVVAFLAVNDGRAALLLQWMAGSTAGADATSASLALALALVTIPLAALFARSLDILSLGEGCSRALGIALAPARLGVMVLAAVLTTGAVLTIGPLTFVGLVGPHLARRLGLHRSASQLPGAALLGGLLMILADWLGRVAIAPFELPSGLTAALIGVPYLLAQLCRRPAR